MALTKKQKEALEAAPLYFGQKEDNLNCFYWTNGENDKWWQPRTVNILKDKGLLVPRYDRRCGVDASVLYKAE